MSEYNKIYDSDGNILYNEQDISELDDRVTALEDGSAEPTLPSYMVTEANTVLSNLVAKCEDKAYLFTVITDSHNDRNEVAPIAWSDAVSAMKWLNVKYKTDAVIHLGDVLEGVVNAEQMKNDLMKPVSDLLGISPKVFYCRGNHESDFAYDDPAHYELISTDELYAIEFRQNEEYVVRPSNKLYYYVDYGEDLRCVFLDSYMIGYAEGQTTSDLRENPDRARYGYDSEQITWFSTVALDTNRQVAVFSHMPASTANMPSNSWWTEENSQSFDSIKAVAKAFITGGGVIVGWFYGHIHDKKKTTLSAAGFTEIGLRNSFYVTESTGGVHNIPNFSIVAIKPDKRRVDVISFGQDADDYFTY